MFKKGDTSVGQYTDAYFFQYLIHNEGSLLKSEGIWCFFAYKFMVMKGECSLRSDRSCGSDIAILMISLLRDHVRLA